MSKWSQNIHFWVNYSFKRRGTVICWNIFLNFLSFEQFSQDILLPLPQMSPSSTINKNRAYPFMQLHKISCLRTVSPFCFSSLDHRHCHNSVQINSQGLICSGLSYWTAAIRPLLRVSAKELITISTQQDFITNHYTFTTIPHMALFPYLSVKAIVFLSACESKSRFSPSAA